MKLRWAQRAGAMALLGLGTAAMAPACVDNETTMVVQFVSADITECVDADYLSWGIMDLAETGEYRNLIEIANQMIVHADDARRRTESDIIILEEAEIVVTGQNGTLSEFTWPIPGIIDASGAGKARSTTTTEIVMVDAAAVAGIQPGETILANITVFGRSEGGVDVESPEFSFPIRTCVGCLSDCSLGDDEDSPGPCDELSEGVENPRRRGMDCELPCNEMRSGLAVCTAP